MRAIPCLFLTLSACLAAPATAQANFELGRMWRFEDPPLAYLEQEYGFKPDAGWFDLVRLSSLRFGGGCSASFVSPKGLIITNHHCVRGNIADAQGENDWVQDGFVARSMDDEVRLPGLTVQQLVATEDVTERMNAGVADDAEAAAVADRRDQNQGEILAAAQQAQPELSHQVVELFQGAVYQLYSYKIYRDVRLVCAPHLQTSHFGGDPDNFTYPRYGIDFSFCRAYEDGRPADTSAHYFQWSDTGPVRGELVFVTGNPGRTQRLLTRAQLEYLRDAQYPILRELIDTRIARFRALAAQSPELEKQLRTQILSLENAQKAYGGMHEALLDPGFMAQKAAAEAEFRGRIAADPQLQAEYGEVWDRLAEVAAGRGANAARERFHTPGGLPLLAKAVALVRAVEADDAEALARAAGGPADVDPLSLAGYVDHLQRAARHLPAEDPMLAVVLAGRSPEEAAARLANDSRLGDDAFVQQLVDGGAEAVRGSDDPALVVARTLLPLVDAAQEQAQNLDAREAVLGRRLGLALFAAYGNAVTPDATFTLRLSDGVVAGYPYNGTLAPFRTTFYGLYARNAEFDNQYPFNLPQVWLDRRDRIDPGRAVNFVCTVDSTGGNSGSPVINQERELVGLLFDGNIESLANDFLFRDAVERSVCVHVEAIAEALEEIYDAGWVLAELRAAAGR